MRLLCDVCAEERLFERPECVDGHDADCPDLMCTDCGTAFVVAPVVMLVDRRSPVILRRDSGRGSAGRADRAA